MIQFSSSLGGLVGQILNQNGGPWNCCCRLRYHASWLETLSVLRGTVLGFQNEPSGNIFVGDWYWRYHIYRIFVTLYVFLFNYLACIYISAPRTVSSVPDTQLCYNFWQVLWAPTRICYYFCNNCNWSHFCETDALSVNSWILKASSCGTFHFCTSHLTITTVHFLSQTVSIVL